LVLRLDLTYRKDVDTQFLHEVEIREKYWQALQDREHLFRNTRSNSIFDNMVGYIWKLEPGELKDWHYHFFFLFNGSQVREDISRADMIGEYWQKVITQGRGIYYNCNAHKDKYKRCGIGMINHYDMELIANLKNEAAPYLAKTGDYMSVCKQDIDIGRTFGKGIVKAKTDNRGRPRNPIYPEPGLNPYPQLS
jgi:hypothetical protein